MLKISPKKVILLCAESKGFYKEGSILYISKEYITYKINNITEESFLNLQRIIHQIEIKNK